MIKIFSCGYFSSFAFLVAKCFRCDKEQACKVACHLYYMHRNPLNTCSTVYTCDFCSFLGERSTLCVDLNSNSALNNTPSRRVQ